MANNIDSKTKRDRLPARREPHWQRIRTGCFLGFRKLDSGEGTWIARWRDEAGKQHYQSLGSMESYDEAESQARVWFASCEDGVSTKMTTVADACTLYVEGLEAEGRKKTARDARERFSQHVMEKPFGKIVLNKLTSQHVKRWRDALVRKTDDPEDVRRSRDTANRHLSNLKAALNAAYIARLVASDAAWATVKSFRDVGKRRENAYLTPQQREALLSACSPHLQRLVTALLLTGARVGEVVALNANDFDRKHGLLTLSGKTGTRTVAISEAASRFFVEQSKGRIGAAPMLTNEAGERWQKHQWIRQFKQAVIEAGLPGDTVIYCLRHTALSEMVMAGLDSLLVAKVAGTSVVMIERHYGHLRHESVKSELDRVRMI